jgi:spore maturation protein CgeB
MVYSSYCEIVLYDSVDQLRERFRKEIEYSDLVIIGSNVPDGIEIGKWVINTASGLKAFYDINAPVTIAKLRNRTCDYLLPKLIPLFDLYLSFSAGQCLTVFECEFGSPDVQPFFCSVDTDLYYPVRKRKDWDLGYLGTFSDDRQGSLNKLLVEPALRWKKGNFIVAGSQYPQSCKWPENIQRIGHLPFNSHRHFYNSQRFTLNITRKDMVEMGYSPSVRLFESAACAVPVISDYWAGIYTIFKPGEEILISSSPDETLKYLTKISEKKRKLIGESAREVVLANHTGENRAAELEQYVYNNRIKQKKKAGYALK